MERTVASPRRQQRCGQNLLSLTSSSWLISHILSLFIHGSLCCWHSQGISSDVSSWGGWERAACVVTPCLEQSLRLGKGDLDLYLWASNLLLPNIPAFWKGQLFFCFEESRGKCV